ncbi:MAG: bifunctional UDP-N-acetylglucosamine diphosphorylase/glucosamine-1-phosphate N-acetyltransferase GlmU [Rhodospirillales bacterium]|nr:bifunctional UDP-N-acetylglucosamine diphosphorylase/glucosamine-1-phosphate N-acetyltransferase GlmU [Rhodospirillales bacterium]
MTKKKTTAIVLAAGLGTRMKSALPKVLHPLAGRPMIGHLMETLEIAGFDKTVVVTASGMDDVAAAVGPHPCVIQQEQLGTAHAVLAARDHLDGFDGEVVVLYGDTPLITVETLHALLAARRGPDNPAVVVLGFRPDDAGAYGRLILDQGGHLNAIVEAREATDGQLKIDLCNSGVMALDGAVLLGILNRIGNDNAKGEYYLTDAVALAREDGRTCAYVEGDVSELTGVNSRAELAVAEEIVQERLRASAMANGATLLDPKTVWFSFDTRLGRDVTIGPNVFFGPGVVVADNVEVRAFSHLEGATLEEGAVVGPFARLRPGARVGKDARVGNFVEVKNATIETGAKVNHLSYVGDARVGAKANIGAGTITCNYDGFSKSHTDIGAGAFIGSNTALVAPVSVGDGAIIGAGSVIAEDVGVDSVALTRATHKEVKGGAKRIRNRKTREKGKS